MFVFKSYCGPLMLEAVTTVAQPLGIKPRRVTPLSLTKKFRNQPFREFH